MKYVVYTQDLLATNKRLNKCIKTNPDAIFAIREVGDHGKRIEVESALNWQALRDLLPDDSVAVAGSTLLTRPAD